MLNLSFSGCGFLGIYHIGVVSAFREHAPEFLTGMISGCSAGSLVAVCAVCDCCLGKISSSTFLSSPHKLAHEIIKFEI
jgi:patatin-like phospholipase domain-containing protein 2